MVAGCIDRFLQPRKGLKTGLVVFPIHGLRPWLFMGIAPSGHVRRNPTPYLGKGELSEPFSKYGGALKRDEAPRFLETSALDTVGSKRDKFLF